jgi:hypothetical protein
VPTNYLTPEGNESGERRALCPSRRGTRTAGIKPAVRLLVVLLLAVGGCSSGPKLDYAEVEGKVTLGGKPLSGVKVWFFPDSQENTQLPYATATTDASGSYTLTLQNGKPGALVGKNRVVVNWPLPERSSNPDKPPPPPPGPPIPLPYTVAGDTPLIVEVKAGGRQTIDVALPK